MENPYQSPEEPHAPLDVLSPMPLERRPPGLVHHVRVVAILMIIQGIFELLMGAGVGVMAMVLPRMMEADMRRAPTPPDMPDMPANFFWIITVVYGAVAAVTLAAGLLHVVAGLQSYRFRGRVLGFVALAGGILTFFNCYCLPTAIGLGVYGLIVYLNGEVSDAFCMGESGCSPDEILATFRR